MSKEALDNLKSLIVFGMLVWITHGVHETKVDIAVIKQQMKGSSYAYYHSDAAGAFNSSGSINHFGG